MSFTGCSIRGCGAVAEGVPSGPRPGSRGNGRRIVGRILGRLGGWRRAWRRPGLVVGPSLVVGGMLTAMLVLTGLVSLLWTPWPVAEMAIDRRFAAPGGLHLLGTDQFGRDVLSQIMVGARNSILVGLVAVGLGLGTGTVLGLLAAARGGWIDGLVMRLSDVTFAFPVVLTAILIMALLGPGVGNAVLAIGIFNVPVFARMTRGSARQVWALDYVLAARAAGRGAVAISLSHVLPNIAAVLIVQATIQFALAIVAEAGLSYLGLGVQPPAPSWGRMLRDAQTLVFQAPMLAVWPGLAIMLAVLGLNLLGDGLRDLLDPRGRRA